MRSNFGSPGNTLRRARGLLENARAYWLQRQLDPPPGTRDEIQAFLNAIHHAANGLALLSGPPLTTRRFGLALSQRAEAVHAPRVYASFLRVLGAEKVEAEDLSSWIKPWENALEGMPPPDHPHQLRPQQKLYYLSAIKTLLKSECLKHALTSVLYRDCRPGPRRTRRDSLRSMEGDLAKSGAVGGTIGGDVAAL